MTRPGVYLHHKGGRYSVLFVATDTTNGVNCGRRMVVFVSLMTGEAHTRRETQFHETVRVTAGGSGVPRFKLIEE